MSFIYGRPTIFKSPFTEPILLIKFNPGKDYFVSLTSRSICIWSGGKHQIILCEYERDNTCINKNGENENVFWKSNGDLLLTICEDKDCDLLKYNLKDIDPIDWGDYTKVDTCYSMEMKVDTILDVSPEGICWICEVEDKSLICYTKDFFLQRWRPETFGGVYKLEEKIPIILQKKFSTKNCLVHHVLNSFKLDYLIILLRNGQVWIVSGLFDKNWYDITINKIDVEDASYIAHYEDWNIIAVGQLDGNVKLFKNLKFVRNLSLSPWEITEMETGGVSCIEWADDGLVMAVGYSNRGFTTWSNDGCRLNCSISHMNVVSGNFKRQMQSNSNETINYHSNYKKKYSNMNENLDIDKFFNDDEVAFYGVRHLSWGRRGYHLFVVAYLNSDREICVIEKYNVYRNCLDVNVNQRGSFTFLMRGEDRLLMLCNRGSKHGNLEWRHLMIPIVYLLDNWPIANVSLSPDKNYIAVSGKWGFTVLNLKRNKWKIFGRLEEERCFSCYKLTWYRDFLIAATHSNVTDKNELFAFHKNLALALSNLACRLKIPNGNVIHIDCNDKHLLLCTIECIYQYEISQNNRPATAPSITLSLLRNVKFNFANVKLDSIMLLPNFTSILKKTSFNEINIGLYSEIISNYKYYRDGRESGSEVQEGVEDELKNALHEGGGGFHGLGVNKLEKQNLLEDSCMLVFIDVFDSLVLASLDNPELYVLSTSIEHFWTYTPAFCVKSVDDDEKILDFALWAYSSSGLEVWIPFFCDSDTKPLVVFSNEKSLEFNREILMSGFIVQWGAILGLTQKTNQIFSNENSTFEIQAKIEPFVNVIIRKMLKKAQKSSASKIAKVYSNVEHFLHSLELLLNEVLEIKTKQKANPSKCINNNFSIYNKNNFIISDKKFYYYFENDDGSGSGDGKLMKKEDVDVSNGNGDFSAPSFDILKITLEFLMEFGYSVYTRIIASCARKIDPTRWYMLFDSQFGAGAPKNLFDLSLKCKELDVAISYLRIIQIMDGELESRNAALRCLRICIDEDDIELFKRLIEFLQKSSFSTPEMTAIAEDLAVGPNSDDLVNNDFVYNRINSKPNQINISNSEIDTITVANQECIFRGLIFECFERLFSSLKLEQLVKVSQVSKYELHTWIRMEGGGLAMIEDYAMVLNGVHSQFRVPRPTHFPLNQILKNPKNLIKNCLIIYYPGSDFAMSEGVSAEGGCHCDTPQSTIISSFRRLEFLLKQMKKSDCTDWILVLSTILFKLGLLLKTMQRHPDRCHRYNDMLKNEASKGYLQLLSYLDGQINGEK